MYICFEWEEEEDDKFGDVIIFEFGKNVKGVFEMIFDC
jgi:hypothetical protein